MNPFAKRVMPAPRESNWQRLIRIMFNGGVAHLPAAPYAPKDSIRRRRRERGRIK